MRKYFTLNLSARTLLRPVAAILLATVLFCQGMLAATNIIATDSAMTVVDGHLALYLLVCGALCFAYGFVVLWAVLPIMEQTIRALSYDDAPFEVEYNRGEYLRKVAGGVALSVVTFGIYSPWLLAKVMRYFAEGVSHKFYLLSFRGKGMRLLAIVVLASVVPSLVIGLVAGVIAGSMPQQVDMMSFAPLAGLLSLLCGLFFAAMFLGLMYQWYVNLTYGDKVVVCRQPLWGSSLYIMGQLLLTVLTVGLYGPMAVLRIMRYIAEHTTIEAEGQKPLTMGLRLRPWSDWGYLWLQTLLLIVTFGLYLPWYYAKVMNRFSSRLYVGQ